MVDAALELLGATCREAQMRGTDRLWQAHALSANVTLRDTIDAEETIRDARRLLLEALCISALDVIKDPDRRLNAAEAARYEDLLARRANGEPISRITGWRGFYGREFMITPATLDPRADSETVITAALNRIGDTWPAGSPLDILDIGTGSGCLLLTLLAELSHARGTGVDPSPEALAVARANATRLGLADRCTWVEGRGFAGLHQRFALIISNPPYIPSNDIARLDREVREHDPRLALDGGPDGLDIYRAIAADLDAHAMPGWVLLEVGHDQASAVAAIMAKALPPDRLGRCLLDTDLGGINRCVALEIIA